MKEKSSGNRRFFLDIYPVGVYNISRIDTPWGYYEVIEMDDMSDNKCPVCSGRKKIRSEEEKKALTLRLKKAEGQIRGIIKMIDEDAYCVDVLVQVSAVSNALNSFNRELLACHIRSCVSEDIKKGDSLAIDEFVKTVQKLMK